MPGFSKAASCFIEKYSAMFGWIGSIVDFS